MVIDASFSHWQQHHVLHIRCCVLTPLQVAALVLAPLQVAAVVLALLQVAAVVLALLQVAALALALLQVAALVLAPHLACSCILLGVLGPHQQAPPPGQWCHPGWRAPEAPPS